MKTKIKKSASKLQQGFTLLELLVVVAIIGTLYGVVALSVQSSRQKGRDAKRAADIKQLASALEAYFTQNNSYPPQTPADLTIPGLDVRYIGQIPVAPLPAEGGCNVTNNAYMYESTNDLNYTVTFCLGDKTGDYSPGPHFLTQQGVQ